MWADEPEHVVVGLPVQQLESLLREAAPGDILLSKEIHDELGETFRQAVYNAQMRDSALPRVRRLADVAPPGSFAARLLRYLVPAIALMLCLYVITQSSFETWRLVAGLLVAGVVLRYISRASSRLAQRA